MNNDHLPDYYEDLKISPNADPETIDRVFRLLAKRYHPDNKVTGDADAFNRISTAYKVLADIEKRASYDAHYACGEGDKSGKHMKPPRLQEAPNMMRRLRKRILSILYVERRNDAAGSGVGLWRIEQLIGLPEKTWNFMCGIMKEKGWIQRTDTGAYAITAAGVDAVEEGEMILSEDHLLPGPADYPGTNKAAPKANHFNPRHRGLIPNPS
ncbi:MAG: J domain-containing protein [Desulfobacterales bacterium]|nr:J domain-containing protein [Desulfobacterales bacterium]